VESRNFLLGIACPSFLARLQHLFRGLTHCLDSGSRYLPIFITIAAREGRMPNTDVKTLVLTLFAANCLSHIIDLSSHAPPIPQSQAKLKLPPIEMPNRQVAC